jgi:tRNA U54 and U55 pseudouridine synthase Pus10
MKGITNVLILKIYTMKKLSGLLFILAFIILFSCGGEKSGSEKESKKESSEEVSSKKKKSVDDETISSCNEFLDRYEEWVDLYIAALKAYKENPFDSETMKKYTEAMSEASVWAQDWSKMHVCAMREKYQKRFEEIADKAEKALEEIGAE